MKKTFEKLAFQKMIHIPTTIGWSIDGFKFIQVINLIIDNKSTDSKMPGLIRRSLYRLTILHNIVCFYRYKFLMIQNDEIWSYLMVRMRSKVDVYYTIKNTNFTVTRLLVIYIGCI